MTRILRTREFSERTHYQGSKRSVVAVAMSLSNSAKRFPCYSKEGSNHIFWNSIGKSGIHLQKSQIFFLRRMADKRQYPSLRSHETSIMDSDDHFIKSWKVCEQFVEFPVGEQNDLTVADSINVKLGWLI